MERVTPDHRPDEESDKASDEELLKLFCDNGDREAFTVLVRRFECELRAYLQKYTGNTEMANDVFQETCFKLFNKAHQFTEGKKLRPWLYSIATRTAIDCQRRNKRFRHLSLQGFTSDAGEDVFENEPVDTSPGPVECSEVKEASDWIRAEVERLSLNMRSVVQLVMLEGLKYRDAAEILGIPVGTVKSRLHHAIKSMHPDHPSKLAG